MVDNSRDRDDDMKMDDQDEMNKAREDSGQNIQDESLKDDV